MAKRRGRRRVRSVNFIPKKINRGKRAANSNEAPIRLARLLEKTRSHRGKYTFVTNGEFPITDHNDIEVLMEKNRHTKRAVRRKMGKPRRRASPRKL